MIHYIQGNLLDSDCDFICHQVNCRGVMGSGVAKQIREKWPVVYKNYSDKCEATAWLNLNPASMLGDIQICALYDDYKQTSKHQHVVNFFSQEYYGYNGNQYTSYDAFWKCLVRLREVTQANATIAFPYKIASDLGGANWEIIRTMIEEVLYDREVFIYYLSETNLTPKDRRVLMT